MKCIGDIHPGADLTPARDPVQEGQCKRSPSRAFRPGDFRDGSKGQSSIKQLIDGWYTGARHRPQDTLDGRQRGWNPVRESVFDLSAEYRGGWHGELSSPYVLLSLGSLVKSDLPQ